jgi:hypothetical protein
VGRGSAPPFATSPYNRLEPDESIVYLELTVSGSPSIPI